MFKKFFSYFIDFIKEEYKFILFLILLLIICEYPVNYYITTGGGISDVSSRIKVADKSKATGSFNISYVEELQGTLLTYGLSYVIPTWERDSADNYKYTTDDSIDDINFRNDLDLKVANSTATYWAYTLANKNVKEISSKMYVIITDNMKYKNPLKVKDEVLAIDGNNYSDLESFRNYIQTKNKDDIVNIKIKRNNKEKTLKCKIYEEDNKKIIGVGIQILKKYEVSPKVRIKFKSSESGPSGGLITALEIYNQLTQKDITKGYTIAGTGTIEQDGTIGEIGGVKYKILGAEKGHADYFLVPAGNNYNDAKKYKEKKHLKIKLIKVSNIENAINKLEKLK